MGFWFVGVGSVGTSRRWDLVGEFASVRSVGPFALLMYGVGTVC